MTVKNIAVLFGGVSPEHEVSIVTGLQVMEHLDRDLYFPLAWMVTGQGELYYLQGCHDRKSFASALKKRLYLGYDAETMSPYFVLEGCEIKHPLYCAINAMHGGGGEGGAMAGLAASFSIPQSSETVESASICMNKTLTKIIVQEAGVRIVPYRSLQRVQFQYIDEFCQSVVGVLGFPLIIKPAHLGSSIAISVAHSLAELELAIQGSLQVDREVVVEQYMSDCAEYNCSVRRVNGKIEVSPIEQPIKQNQMLSFEDKYLRGAKKLGGMSDLPRKVPAPITPDLAAQIVAEAKKVYLACRCQGVVRIDWIVHAELLYCNEINPIPGSLASYLWETTGELFRAQLHQLILQTRERWFSSPLLCVETSDLVKKFTR
ncbi:MAG: hypothetical protein QM538_04850 [Methylacidiphilales bacterium]|nr:hypothetical protein [Candidatus Methylacidiphilales bacterium]